MLKAVLICSSPERMRQAKNAMQSFLMYNLDYIGRIYQKHQLPISSASLHHWTGPGRAEAMLQLFDEGFKQVVYIDTDTETYAECGFDLEACNADMILTPHVLKPISNDTNASFMRQIRLMGLYNSGVQVVGPGARPFIEWWLHQTLHHGQNQPQFGEVTEQGWLEYAPSFMGTRCYISQDLGINMAYWRMRDHVVMREPKTNKWLVDDVPLKIFHFSGITQESPRASASRFRKDQLLPEAALPLFDAYRKAVFE